MGELWKYQGGRMDHEKENDPTTDRKNRNVYFCVANSRYFFFVHPHGDKHTKNNI